jgi:hypothetical protein
MKIQGIMKDLMIQCRILFNNIKTCPNFNKASTRTIINLIYNINKMKIKVFILPIVFLNNKIIKK